MSFRERLGDIIFETDTPAARGFDVALLWAIVLSVALVLLESMAGVRARYGDTLRTLEWVFTGLFTIEYVARIYTARKPLRYVRSFYGVIDALAILPTYLSVVLVGSQYLLVIRSLRLLRVFRVLKAARYLGQAGVLVRALRASREKITVFLVTVLTLVLIIGSAMYLIEGPANGFDSIPVAIYWAIVTLTTVGYGDVAPGTPVGKTLAAAVMILGYAIIAVPTGIVTSELTRASVWESRPAPMADPEPTPDADANGGGSRSCDACGAGGHAADAAFCRRCGAPLPGASDQEPG
ncbi:MAG: ion transporter [Trueperaceae bacterium]|nr:ion transporter [Trueperaceae bacterium]